MSAVEIDGMCLEYAAPQLQDDLEIVCCAVEQDDLEGCVITSRIVLILELISDVLGITLHHWPARGVNYSRAELHYISRPVGELINNSITSLSF